MPIFSFCVIQIPRRYVAAAIVVEELCFGLICMLSNYGSVYSAKLLRDSNCFGTSISSLYLSLVTYHTSPVR